MPCVPQPMYAIVILSLGATWPRPPSTCLGTMVNAATPAAVEARNSRRLMSSLAAIVILSGNRSRDCVAYRFDFRAGYGTARLHGSQRRTLPGCRVVPNMARAGTDGYSGPSTGTPEASARRELSRSGRQGAREAALAA